MSREIGLLFTSKLWVEKSIKCISETIYGKWDKLNNIVHKKVSHLESEDYYKSIGGKFQIGVLSLGIVYLAILISYFYGIYILLPTIFISLFLLYFEKKTHKRREKIHSSGTKYDIIRNFVENYIHCKFMKVDAHCYTDFSSEIREELASKNSIKNREHCFDFIYQLSICLTMVLALFLEFKDSFPVVKIIFLMHIFGTFRSFSSRINRLLFSMSNNFSFFSETSANKINNTKKNKIKNRKKKEKISLGQDRYLGILTDNSVKSKISHFKIKLSSENKDTDITWENTAAVMSNSGVFQGTLSENICSTSLESQSRVIATLEYCNLSNLKSGLKSPAMFLSGGQKQTISIARVLYTPMNNLILFQPFKGIDHNNKTLLQKKLKTISKKKPVLLVSNRYSDLIYCDKIINFTVANKIPIDKIKINNSSIQTISRDSRISENPMEKNKYKIRNPNSIDTPNKSRSLPYKKLICLATILACVPAFLQFIQFYNLITGINPNSLNVEAQTVIVFIFIWLASIIFQYSTDIAFLKLDSKLKIYAMEKLIKPLFLNKPENNFIQSSGKLKNKLVRNTNSFNKIASSIIRYGLGGLFTLAITILISITIHFNLIYAYIPIIGGTLISFYFLKKSSRKVNNEKFEFRPLNVTLMELEKHLLLNPMSHYKIYKEKSMNKFFLDMKKTIHHKHSLRIRKFALTSTYLLLVFLTCILIIFYFYQVENHQMVIVSLLLIRTILGMGKMFMDSCFSLMNQFPSIYALLGKNPKSKTRKNFEVKKPLDIVMKNITVQFKNKSILENTNVVIPEGRTIAIVGSTGSGKSSLLNSVLNIIPKKGNILIGNIDSNDFSFKELISQITYIPQFFNPIDSTLGDFFRDYNSKLVRSSIKKLEDYYPINDLFF